MLIIIKSHLFLSGRYYLNLLLNPKLPPSADSQETQISVPKESIYKEKIQSNKKFDTRVNWNNIKWLQKFFHENLMEDKNASYNKSLGIVSNIIKESFGEPTTKQDGEVRIWFTSMDNRER